MIAEGLSSKLRAALKKISDLLEVPAPKPAGWIEPLSGAHVARHAADGRVRDELTMAGA